MKLEKNCLYWGRSFFKPEFKHCAHDFYYFRIDWMTKEDRKNLEELHIKPIDFYKVWYDQPHAVLNLFFFCFSWSTQWTTDKGCFK